MDQYFKTLAEFISYGGAGVIYGGCLRDAYCGVGPVKDIDIAVEDTAANREAIDRFIEGRKRYGDDLLAGLLIPLSVTRQPLGYGNFPDVVESIQITLPPGLDVNFVILDFKAPFTPELVAERCDFGICQIAYDGERIYTTEAFSRDFARRTFTYLREPFDEAQYARSVRRFERLQQKFKGWRMTVPAFDQPAKATELI